MDEIMGNTGFDRKKYMMLLLIAGGVVLLDQLTKAVILNQLPLYRTIPVIPGLFNITDRKSTRLNSSHYS